MGNLIQDMLAADAAEIVGDIGSKVTWKGAEYDALVAEPTVTLDLEEGGIASSGDFEIRIPRAQFGNGDTPQEGQVITFEGKRYAIKRGGFERKSDAFIRITLSTNL
jgi:hypothetical protein